MMHSPLLIENLSKEFLLRSGTFRAVHQLSLAVEPGQCLGLLGPNGAGKTTTIQCLTGNLLPSSGRVLIDGMDMHRYPKKSRKLLGVVFQEEALEWELSVYAQLSVYGIYFGMPRAVVAERANILLKRVGLSDRATAPVLSLSGGQRRRLMLARALLHSPRVLVLDEPSTGLDPSARQLLWDLIDEEKKCGTAILLTTHYMAEAERLCDQIALMADGRILDQASPRELIERYVEEKEVVEEIRPGVLWRRPPNLEDVFLRLSGGGLYPRESQGDAGHQQNALLD